MQLIEDIYRERLKLLAKEFGSQVALANKLERSPSQIGQWINAAKDSKTGKPRSMDRSTARYIEKMTGKPEGWMDQPIQSLFESSIFDQEISPKPIAGDNIELALIYGKVPLISWVQAGSWCDSNVSFEPGDAEEWLLCSAPHGKHTFALRVRGDSMDSKDGYREGEIIFVDPEIETTPNDDIVVRVGTSHTFKRLRQDENGLYLWALNEHWNPRMQRLEGDFYICGKVILSQMKR
jgi:SOS-response transcriptional repressor LexA